MTTGRIEGLLKNRGGLADLQPFGHASLADPRLLQTSSFLAILAWISAGRLSGVLKVHDTKAGWEVGAERGVLKRVEKVGQNFTGLVLGRLVQEGVVTTALANEVAAGTRPALQALYESGHVAPRAIVEGIRGVKETLLTELLSLPNGAWEFLPGDLGGKPDPVTIDAPVYLAHQVRERAREAHGNEIEPLLHPYIGRYPFRAETLNAAVMGTVFGEKDARALEDLTAGTMPLREAIATSPLLRVATLRLFLLAGFSGLVEFRSTGVSRMTRDEQMSELKREFDRMRAADFFVRLGLHYTTHPKHLPAAHAKLAERFGKSAPERALGPEAERICDRLLTMVEEAYAVVGHTEPRRNYRRTAIGSGTMKFGSEFLLKQANILLFREEWDAAMETIEAAIDIEARPEFLEFRTKVNRTRAEAAANRRR